MPTKHRKRRQQMRVRYASTTMHEQNQARTRYARNSDVITERSSQRMQTDETLRKKNRQRSALYMTDKIANDVLYREKNRVRAAQSIKRRLETDEAYRNQHVASAKRYRRMKLDKDADCRRANRESAKQYRKKKLLNDVKYRYRDLQHTKNRLKTNVTACETNKRRAMNRYQNIRKQKQQKDYHRAVVYAGRHDQTNDLPAHIRRQMRKQRVKRKLSGCLHSTVKSLTPQQRYWVRRSRLMAVARQRQTTRHLQEQMQAQSGSSMLDIQLLFNKAV